MVLASYRTVKTKALEKGSCSWAQISSVQFTLDRFSSAEMAWAQWTRDTLAECAGHKCREPGDPEKIRWAGEGSGARDRGQFLRQLWGDCDRVSSHNFMLISVSVDGAFIALSSVLRPIIVLIPRLSPIWLVLVDSQLPFMGTSSLFVSSAFNISIKWFFWTGASFTICPCYQKVMIHWRSEHLPSEIFVRHSGVTHG